MSQDPVVLNGVNGADGHYLMPELSVQQVSRLAQGEELDAVHLAELSALSDSNAPTFGVRFGIDPEDLAQAGWAVVFPSEIDSSVLAALEPLLSYRRSLAGPALYREYKGPDGYRPGETARTWLARDPRSKGPGPAQPDKVPYYLLIVGDPEEIPFRFQYELDVNYAVGRIHFDTPAEYAQYARGVVAAETRSRPAAARRAAFFGVRNPGDRATALSTEHLVEPLAKALATGGVIVDTIAPDNATRAALEALLGAHQTPDVLFTASHGMGFPNADARQRDHQGALLCRDWPGPFGHTGPIPSEFYFSADNLKDVGSLNGLIAFFFACYGAGTPRWDDYAHRNHQSVEIAPQPFMARLPQKALSHPEGGALAVVGHVERAWTYSFVWPRAGEDVVVFQSTLEAVLDGRRLGAAMEAFAMKYADLTVGLSGELEDIHFGKKPDDLSLANLWTATNDSRSYVIIGDPAVRIA